MDGYRAFTAGPGFSVAIVGVVSPLLICVAIAASRSASPVQWALLIALFGLAIAANLNVDLRGL
jgi:hypothetical protein